jgi:L-rhamnose isomerase
MIKALVYALLEPLERLQKTEIQGDFTARLAVMEKLKTFPIGAVWDYYCIKREVPYGMTWLS